MGESHQYSLGITIMEPWGCLMVSFKDGGILKLISSTLVKLASPD